MSGAIFFSSRSILFVGLIVQVDVGIEVKVERVKFILDDARIEAKDLRHGRVEMETDLQSLVCSLLVSCDSFDGQIAVIAVGLAAVGAAGCPALISSHHMANLLVNLCDMSAQQ